MGTMPCSQRRTLLAIASLFVSIVGAASSQSADSEHSGQVAQSSAQKASPVVSSSSRAETGSRSVASSTFASSRTTTKASEASTRSMTVSPTGHASSISAKVQPSPPKQAPAVSSDSKMAATANTTTHSAPPPTPSTKKDPSPPKPPPSSTSPQPTTHTTPAPHTSPSPTKAPPPPGTAPKVSTTPASSHPPSVEPSHSPSTTVSVTFVNGPLSQTTVTTHPNSTFAAPVSVTALNSLGSSVLTAPPLVTVMSTSILPNGQMSTVTQVVANPPDSVGRVNAIENNGFFHNSGAVAGVFTAIGVAAAAVLAALVFCIRRRRRTQRRKRWLAGMKPQGAYQQDDPFRDPVNNYEDKPPTIASTMGDGTRSDGHSNSHLVPHRMSVHDYNNVMGEKGNFMLYPDPYPLFNPDLMVRPPMPEPYQDMQDIDLGHHEVAHMQPPLRSQFRRSYAPSTPSIYPATLPGESEIAVTGHEGNNLNAFNHPSGPAQTSGKRDHPVPPTIVVPPRPPRSQLRDSVKNMGFAPLTPPDSVASNSLSSKPPSPISPVTESHPRDVLTRKTILDIRPRPGGF